MRLWCLLRRDIGCKVFVADPQLGPRGESMGIASWTRALWVYVFVGRSFRPCMIAVFEYTFVS